MGKVEKQEQDLWRFEQEARKAGYQRIAGVDEAGRGPLAGPVVAAAVILPPDFDTTGIRDSKALSPAQREKAHQRILDEALAVGVGIIDSETIDRINILKATHEAMRAALRDMGAAFDFVLVDGLPIKNFGYPHRGIVKGDNKSVSIAAASIVAKVTRDCMMVELAKKFPGYGFEKHKGYYTEEHVRAIRELGACDVHRRTFAPVSESEEVKNDCPQRNLF